MPVIRTPEDRSHITVYRFSVPRGSYGYWSIRHLNVSSNVRLLHVGYRAVKNRRYMFVINCCTPHPASQNLLHRQRRSVQDRKERYDNGLLKLADTEEQVAQMQVDLEELQPKLKEATIATDALLVQIAKDTGVANEKKAAVEKEASSNTCFRVFPCEGQW